MASTVANRAWATRPRSATLKAVTQRVRVEPSRAYNVPGKSTHHDAYGNPIAGSYTKRYDANGVPVRTDRAYDAYGNPVPATYTTAQRTQRTTRTDGPSPYERTPPVFQQIEDMIIDNFNSEEPGSRLDWQEVEGCWVLRPPARAGPPEAVALFLGGAFVGAAPEITYRLMLEALADRNVMVVTVPYATSFDHLRIVDEVQFKFDRCMKGIAPEVQGLPIYGIGHSLGAHLTLLINSRFAVHRDGNALISYNNRPATDVIPVLSPILAPGTRALGPVLSQLATLPMRSSVDSAIDSLRMMSPSLLQMLLPLVDQLAPVFMDVSQGRQEFSPSPQEANALVRTYYSINRNLLVRFKNDEIDESSRLSNLLQSEAAISRNMDLTVRTLAGDHMRPLAQSLGDLHPDIARLAHSAIQGSGSLIGSLSGVAHQVGLTQIEGPLKSMGRQVSDMRSVVGGPSGGPMTESAHNLADELANWMGVSRNSTLQVETHVRRSRTRV